MSEERNRNFSRREERRERRTKVLMERRNHHRMRREERIAWMKARHEKRCKGDFHDGREWFGILIIIIGLIWLVKELWGPYPDWLFSWQALMIAVGLALGLSSHFRNKGSFILIILGLAFMSRDFIFPDLDLGPYIWPVIIIAIGIIFLMKKRAEDRFKEYVRQHPEEFKDWRHHWHNEAPTWPPSSSFQDSEKNKKEASFEATKTPSEGSSSTELPHAIVTPVEDPYGKRKEDIEDWLDITTVFSGTKRNVLSKNFKGGEIVNIFGGSEIDLSRADITGDVALDLTNIMGGIRLAIPPNWQLKFNCTCIMGGTDDRRRSDSRHDPNKTLTLTGIILMGGVEVRDIL